MQFDLHVHSNISFDAKIKIGILLRNLKEIGLDGIALTDHDSIEAVPKAKEIAEKYDVKVFTGVEISTRSGHIIAYGINENPPYKLSVGETIDWIKDNNGLAVCAHPFRTSSPSLLEEVYNHKFEALEINARCRLSQNKTAEIAASMMHLPLIGGSDAHFLSCVGYINTYFEDEINDEDDLITAVKKGKCDVMYRIPISIQGELIPAMPKEELTIIDKVLEESKPTPQVIEANTGGIRFFDTKQKD
ncbi:MAG: PHP domain-containing protein [Asgard group archaeon]|nr:PHP domain-containing protein [Asgard group archaeon]